jgi:hypothetical protein
MKQVEKIWAELSAKQVENTQEVELSEEKVELGQYGNIDDFQTKYKQIAAKAPKLKKIVMDAGMELDDVSRDLWNLADDIQQFYAAARDMGAKDLAKQASTLYNASSSLSKGWKKAANAITMAAKEV